MLISVAINLSESDMKTITASAIAFSAFAFVAITGSGAAMARSYPTAESNYCLSDVDGGSQECDFATYAQCEQTASGIGADCSANVLRDESRSAYSLGKPMMHRG
jgi:hypothetical protein